MKKVIFSLLLAGLIAGSCFAEVLMTAKPQGAGNVSLQLFSSTTPFIRFEGNSTITGTKIIYGLNYYTDVLIKTGTCKNSFDEDNPPATENGAGIKYAIPKEWWDTPFDVAAVFNTDTISGKGFTQTMNTIGMIESGKLSIGVEIYSLFYAMQNSEKIAGQKAESSNDIMWGFGTKYTFPKSHASWLMENLAYTMGGDTYHTACFAIQYDFSAFGE
jgi:hypothetical protein